VRASGRSVAVAVGVVLVGVVLGSRPGRVRRVAGANPRTV